MSSSNNQRSKTATMVALTVGLAGTILCLFVIYRTAQLPAGDGTGMQWLVLWPLTLFFFGIVAPSLIFGVSGLRAWRAPHGQQREQEAQSFGTLKVVMIILLILIFGVLPLATNLILLVMGE